VNIPRFGVRGEGCTIRTIHRHGIEVLPEAKFSLEVMLEMNPDNWSHFSDVVIYWTIECATNTWFESVVPVRFATKALYMRWCGAFRAVQCRWRYKRARRIRCIALLNYMLKGVAHRLPRVLGLLHDVAPKVIRSFF
jgi:hypothetical protein